MTSLVLAHRRTENSGATFDDHTQRLPGGLEALVGPVSPDAASSLDREMASVGLAIFPDAVDMLVDCGRILSGARGQQEILRAADHVVVVTRPDAAGLAHARWTLDVVRNLKTEGTSSFVVVGPSQFSSKEIEEVFQARLLAAIPLDGQSAAMACGSPGRPRRFARGDLVASARCLVEKLLGPADAERDAGATEVASLGSVSIDRHSSFPDVELAVAGENGVDTG
jgi:hypothetical protein